MKTALFTNFTDEEYTGYWNGKGRKFEPGQSLTIPDYLARHYAKHLVNRELLRTDKDGNLLHKNGDKMTSPKHLGEDDSKVHPLFMELFNKAYKKTSSDSIGEEGDDVEAVAESDNQNAKQDPATKGTPEVQTSPDDEFEEKA